MSTDSDQEPRKDAADPEDLEGSRRQVRRDDSRTTLSYELRRDNLVRPRVKSSCVKQQYSDVRCGVVVCVLVNGKTAPTAYLVRRRAPSVHPCVAVEGEERRGEEDPTITLTLI